jgi:hypothetical protein
VLRERGNTLAVAPVGVRQKARPPRQGSDLALGSNPATSP